MNKLNILFVWISIFCLTVPTYMSAQCDAEFSYESSVFCQHQGVIMVSHISGTDGTYSFTSATGGNLVLDPFTGSVDLEASDIGTFTITNTVTSGGPGQDMAITGVIDGPLTGGNPKAIEFYAYADIPDLSMYGFGSANNGGGSDGQEFTFPAVFVAANTYIYVASESTEFFNFFGFAPDYISGAANINGDDAIELFMNNNVIDVFGDINVDGSGEPWEYMDGWAYRNNDSNPGSFNINNWTFSGVNALDGETNNATANAPFPTGTYTFTAAPPCMDEHSVTIDIQDAIFVDAGQSQIQCGVSPVFLNANASDAGIWSGGTGSFNNPTSANVLYTPHPSEEGNTLQLVYTVSGNCGFVSDEVSVSLLRPAEDAEFYYDSNEFCPNAGNAIVNHTTGIDGWYTVTMGDPTNIMLNAQTGEIDIENSLPGTYEITNTVSGCGNLIITAVFDGPLSGGRPKGVELYVLDDISDLSIYGLGCANNGGGSDGEEFSFPTGTASRGDYIYVSSELAGFISFFGFNPNYTTSALNMNGDDAVELFCSGQVIDVFGEIDVDGSGQAWEYLDGWAYRLSETGIDGSTFDPFNWIYSGANALDNETSNASAANPVPIATYTNSLGSICPNSLASQIIILQDFTAPSIECSDNIIVNLSPGACEEYVFFGEPQVEDDCVSDFIINQISGPTSGSLLNKNDSPFEVTFEITDIYNNGPYLCSFQIEINEYQSPNPNLACNGILFITLGSECEAVITADMMLEGGPYGCYDDYLIEIAGISGNTITSPGTYSATITDPDTNNNCTSTINVEDKQPPVIDCVSPCLLNACEYKCYELEAILDGHIAVPEPEVEDCSSYSTAYSDNVNLNDCGITTITRTWLVTDAGGYTASCEQEIIIEPINTSDISLPPDNVELPCGNSTDPEDIATYFDNPFTQDNPNTPFIENNEGYALAYPHYFIGSHAQKIDNGVCKITADYTDMVIPACNTGCNDVMKVIRTWTLLDWCSQEITTYEQIIKAIDTEAPTFTVNDMQVTTNPWGGCNADVYMNLPQQMHDNCSGEMDYSISGPIGVTLLPPNTSQNPANNWLAIGVPKGDHIFTYHVSDCCGNVASQNMTVKVTGIPPVAVAKQNIVLSLSIGTGNYGSAKIFAEDVDNGSYDVCTDVHLEIRRPVSEDDCRNTGIGGYNNNLSYNNDFHPHDDQRDTDNGAFVKFCCSDVTDIDENGIPFGIVKVEMRVWNDGDGNGIFGTAGDQYNTTWANIRVEDKTPPVLECPDDITITNNEDYLDTDITGNAIAYAVCDNRPTEFADVEVVLDSCLQGYVIRRWSTPGANLYCDQRIDIVKGNSAIVCGTISGKISTANERNISDVEMILHTSIAEMPINIKTTLTDSNGVYAFVDNPVWADYILIAEKTGDWKNGVNTLDLILIQRHILGLQTLDSPYKMIAADVDSDGRIRVSDIIELRKLLLNVIPEFSNNESWRFVETGTAISTNPKIDFTESIEWQNLNANTTTKDFTGVKIGDVDDSALANQLYSEPEERQENELILLLEEKHTAKRALVEIPVRSPNYVNVHGFQFTMELNGLTFVGVNPGVLSIQEENIGRITDNLITTSHGDIKPKTTGSDEVLFTLIFKTEESGDITEMVTISSRLTKAEAYMGPVIETTDIRLEIETKETVKNGYALYQNRPNPFSSTTTISFNMAEKGHAQISIYDISGKVVKVIKDVYPAGYNQEEINLTDLEMSGILFYRLESNHFTATKKMVVME